MMKNYFLIAVLVVLAACSRPQEHLMEQITAAEKELEMGNPDMPSFERADSLIKMYMNYADQYKDDTLSPSYIYKAAELCVKTGRYDQAVAHLGSVQRYPNFKKVGDALFMQGFISDTHLHDTVAARKYYEKFRLTYPKHEFADDAGYLLENLNMSTEELISKLESQQQAADSLMAKQ